MSIARVVDNYDNSVTPHGVVEETIGTAETGNPIYLRGNPCSVALHPSGTAKVQFTLSTEAHVDANTALWMDWARGEVTAAAADIPEGPVTAVRGVSISGSVVIEVVR